MAFALIVLPVAFGGACRSATSHSEREVMADSTEPERPQVFPSSADVPTTMQQEPDCFYRRILCFGDSLTYGTTFRTAKGRSLLAPVEGYIPKLTRLLIGAYGREFQLINSGVGAETTTRGRDRLGEEIDRHDPELVLLLQGVVDAAKREPNFLKIRRNLETMMEEVLGRDIALIIGTVPPLHPDGFRINAIDHVPTLNTIIREVAETQGVPVADHAIAFEGDAGLQGPDGLHPNAKGYEVMAETWFQEISDLVTAGCR